MEPVNNLRDCFSDRDRDKTRGKEGLIEFTRKGLVVRDASLLNLRNAQSSTVPTSLIRGGCCYWEDLSELGEGSIAEWGTKDNG